MEREEHNGQPSLHRPAMLPQVLELLQPRPAQVALDLTVGTGGHAIALASALGPEGLLVCVDADAEALSTARARLEAEAPCPVRLFACPFSRAPRIAEEAGVAAFDLVLADLGVGTHQLEDRRRGFSFDSECRLDMRYDPTAGPAAWEVVNQMPEQELADVFYRYGEERYSRQIAARICRERRQKSIDTPAELADLVKSVVARRTPRRHTWRIHPATRVMMALRIYVNREMEELEALLEALPGLLASGGRAAILTYHSLEARRVKHAWRRQQKEGLLEVLTPSPLKPTDQQVSENPRIRSAQLRAARKR
ncbi:MAG: 16S rRNA (cytosine(1402)-N(4))-methyltransferase RsmH [Planctomycetota bacterium]